MKGVCGDHTVGQVEVVEEVTQCGNLVGLRGDLQLTDHRSCTVVVGGDQVWGAGVRIRRCAGTTDGLSIDGDDPTVVNGGRAGPHPGAEDTVEQVGVNVGHSASDRSFRWSSVQFNTEIGDRGVDRVVDPLRYRGQRLRTGEDRGQREGEQSGQTVSDTTGIPMVSHPGEQVGQGRGDQWSCGFDRSGVGQG